MASYSGAATDYFGCEVTGKDVGLESYWVDISWTLPLNCHICDIQKQCNNCENKVIINEVTLHHLLLMLNLNYPQSNGQINKKFTAITFKVIYFIYSEQNETKVISKLDL